MLAAFFWIFILQTLILLAGEIALREQWLPTNFAPLDNFVQAVTAVAYLALGLTPIAATLFVIIGGLIFGTKHVRSDRES
ncbi:MAG: hypothetical protein KKB02_02095 [Alphaproteobacteria bacterium]|nr:hypothetical protein [Alphaproteobacteria bacterium]